MYLIAFGLYFIGCVIALGVFLLGTNPKLNTVNWFWPVIFLWPVMALWWLIFYPVYFITFIQSKFFEWKAKRNEAGGE